MSKVKLDVTGVVLVFPVVSLVHHLAGGSPAAAWTLLCMCPWSSPHYNAGWPEGSQSPPRSFALSHQAGRHHLKLQLQHQPWYLHSLPGLSKVSQTLLVSLCFFFLFSSFYFKFLFYSKRCVHQPQEVFIHQASKVNWIVSTRHKEQGTRLLQKEGENRTLTDGWPDSYNTVQMFEPFQGRT